MAITVDSIANGIIEGVEWSYRNGKLRANVDISDAIHEAIDSALIYTFDIVDYWLHNNTPEPENMGAHDSIVSAITEAVYFDLVEKVTEYLTDFIETREATLDALGVDDDTPREAFAEFMHSL